MIRLNGITWNHSRGFSSIVACSQRFTELNPEVEIVWEKRSLQAFADEPIDQLAQKFDFLIIDHPWIGFAARTEVIIPLDTILTDSFLHDQASNSVGQSHKSYTFNNRQWALAIDAATPVAAYRPDLLVSQSVTVPTTFKELIELSKTGKVAIPGIPQDTLMSFYMLCSSLGEDVCQNETSVVSNATGIKALEMLRELGSSIRTECYDWNPIKVYEAMTQTDEYIYSPFAYGYSNYSRRGYAKKLLKFDDMVSINGQKLISTLGGTGLAVSANCENLKVASQFVTYVGSPDVQMGIFFDNGGQPGHRKAWNDKYTNELTLDFFKDTLPALDRSFLRPRYAGHMYFQDRAGEPIRDFMIRGGKAQTLLNCLNKLYRDSKRL